MSLLLNQTEITATPTLASAVWHVPLPLLDLAVASVPRVTVVMAGSVPGSLLVQIDLALKVLSAPTQCQAISVVPALLVTLVMDLASDVEE